MPLPKPNKERDLMGKYIINADAWRQATLVLLRYPETKAQFMKAVEESRTRTSERKKGGAKPSHPDPTANAAIRLYNDVRYQRLKREVCAVEEAMAGMDGIEREVIRRRFWNHAAGSRKVCAYAYMKDVGYSRRHMQKIVRRVIQRVAYNLGEM